MSYEKFPHWFKYAQEMVLKRPAILVCLNNDEFVSHVNYNIPLQFQMSPEYLKKLVNPHREDISDTFKVHYEQFNIWWHDVRHKSKIAIYEKMEVAGQTWPREMEILSRRFKGFQKQDHLKLEADINAKVDTTVRINFTEKK